jgi:hypothetical protein
LQPVSAGFFPVYRSPTAPVEREDLATVSAAQVLGKEGCVDE